MTLYIIRGDRVAAYASAPARPSAAELRGRAGGQRAIECPTGGALEWAAGDDAGQDVQGPQDGGSAPVG